MENEVLIQTEERAIGGKVAPTYIARDIHGWMGLKMDYSYWFKLRVAQLKLACGVDYEEILLPNYIGQDSGSKNIGKNRGWGGSNRKDHVVGLDTGFYLASGGTTVKAQKVRKFLIKVTLKRMGQVSEMLESAKQNLETMRLELESKRNEFDSYIRLTHRAYHPICEKAELLDTLTQQDGWMDVTEMYSTLGVKEMDKVQFFLYLRTRDILNFEGAGYNLPNESLVSVGCAKSVPTHITKNGRTLHKAVFNLEGVNKVRNLLLGDGFELSGRKENRVTVKPSAFVGRPAPQPTQQVSPPRSLPVDTSKYTLAEIFSSRVKGSVRP